MNHQDLIITPIFLGFIILGLVIIRPRVTSTDDRVYFIPAFLLKLVGAIALGVIYDFYYGGGDTFNYTQHGSVHLYQAFLEEPITAIKMMLSPGDYTGAMYKYGVRIWYYDDPPSFIIVSIAAIFGLLNLHTYSSIAALFALFSFSGLWAMYRALTKVYGLHRTFAIALFLIPSVVFWGSGVLKDTVILGTIGWLIWAFVQKLVLGRRGSWYWIVMIACFFLIIKIKAFIILCLFPALIVWYAHHKITTVRGAIPKGFYLLYFAALTILFWPLVTGLVASINEKYSLENIRYTAMITAYDNSAWTVREGGSSYQLGDYDFSESGLLRKFLPAVNVALFRPYPTEINGPVMLMASIESMLVLALTTVVLIIGGLRRIPLAIANPFFMFCLIFSISMAFAVGVSSGNYGSLVRYKIPLMPFYIMMILQLIPRSFQIMHGQNRNTSR